MPVIRDPVEFLHSRNSPQESFPLALSHYTSPKAPYGTPHASESSTLAAVLRGPDMIVVTPMRKSRQTEQCEAVTL